MWEEESTGSSHISSRDGPESARESVVDTDEEAELYSYIHHEHADQPQTFGSPGNVNKISSSSISSGPTSSFLSLLEGQKQAQEPKESNQAQTKQSAPTSVYGNRIYEVVRGKIKSWSKPESSILNWLGDVPEKNFNKSHLQRSGPSIPSDNPVCTELKKAPPVKPGGVKLSVTYQVAETTVNISPFNSCARLESSAVNWMRDVSCNGSKSPKSPNLNSVKDSQVSSDANKTTKSQPSRPNTSKGNNGDPASEETDKTNPAKVYSGSTSRSGPPPVTNDAPKKTTNPPTKPESTNPRVASSTLQQAKIAPFITSPKVMRGSAASLQVGSFSMDNHNGDKLSKKKMKSQKVAFVTPLTEVGQRNPSSKTDVEPCRSKSNSSVTFSTKEKDEAFESKYSYSGRRSARHSSPQRVDFSGGNSTKQGKNQHANADKASNNQNKSALKKKGEKLVVDYCDSPKEVVTLLSPSSDASCVVIPESDLSSDLESVHSGKQHVELPISIAIHIGDASRNVVVRNTSSESTVQEPKIKKRKLKNESKKSVSSKATRKSDSAVGLVSDTAISFEEKMRRFYDSEHSDIEQDDAQRRVSGDWSVLDVDRHANIKASNRYFVGFDQKQKLFCGNCKQRGHVMRTCPEPRRILHCTLCGEPYHKAEVCFEMTCSRCLRRGHSTDSCQVSSKYLDPPCNLCWMPGHMEDQCPDYWRRYYLTTKVGPIVQGNMTESKETSCYNCASKFHWGYECRKPRMCPDIYPTYPFVVSYDQPHPPRSKNHNSNRLSAGRDVAHIEKEIYRLVAASNYVWQQESAEMRRSHKRFKGVKKMTVEERRKVKQEAKLKKRVENAQRRLDRKVQKEHPGTSKTQNRVAHNRQNIASETWTAQSARGNKFGYNRQLNHGCQFSNKKHGTDSSLFQEPRVNKNSIGRKRAQNRVVRFTGNSWKGEMEGSGRTKRKRKSKKKNSLN